MTGRRAPVPKTCLQSEYQSVLYCRLERPHACQFLSAMRAVAVGAGQILPAYGCLHGSWRIDFKGPMRRARNRGAARQAARARRSSACLARNWAGCQLVLQCMHDRCL